MTTAAAESPFGPILYRFYCAGELLFELNGAFVYDTATPYQYVIRRFQELTERLRAGQPVTMVHQLRPELSVELTSVEQFREWVATKFNDASNGGFEQYIV